MTFEKIEVEIKDPLITSYCAKGLTFLFYKSFIKFFLSYQTKFCHIMYIKNYVCILIEI